MTTDKGLSNFLKERNEALLSLDLAYARRMLPRASSDEVRIIAMHKARYECTQLPKEARNISAEWLRERGYGRMMPGDPLLPPGILPGDVQGL